MMMYSLLLSVMPFRVLPSCYKTFTNYYGENGDLRPPLFFGDQILMRQYL
jgi:hypothetical protein